MALFAEDLRVRLGFSTDDWTSDDEVRAYAVLASARVVIATIAGVAAVAQAEADDDVRKLDALDEATMAYAVPIFANPERVLQRRQGDDISVSFANADDAVSGLKEARAIINAAGFGDALGSAFSVDTAATYGESHAEWCSIVFGANYCDCGAVLAGYPIFSEPE